MSEEFGPDIITIVDDDGEEMNLEYVAELDDNGNTYVCFLPADMDEDDPDYGLVILRSIYDENNEELFESVDDDDELDAIYNKFMVLFEEDEEASGEEK